jgi:hypothetical protein
VPGGHAQRRRSNGRSPSQAAANASRRKCRHRRRCLQHASHLSPEKRRRIGHLVGELLAEPPSLGSGHNCLLVLATTGAAHARPRAHGCMRRSRLNAVLLVASSSTGGSGDSACPPILRLSSESPTGSPSSRVRRRVRRRGSTRRCPRRRADLGANCTVESARLACESRISRAVFRPFLEPSCYIGTRIHRGVIHGRRLRRSHGLAAGSQRWPHPPLRSSLRADRHT